MQKYTEAIKHNIDKLMEMEPTPERAQAMANYLYIKKHLMGHDDMHSMMDNPGMDNPRKSYFGG